MPEPEAVYSELLEASGSKDELYEVGQDIIELSFEVDAVGIEYKTMDTNLAVGEHTTDPTRFFADSVRVQNIAGAGARVVLRGSYYDRVHTMDVVKPSPNLEPRRGETVTVIVELSVVLSEHGIEGEGMVLYKKRED